MEYSKEDLMEAKKDTRNLRKTERLYQSALVHRNVNPRIDTKKCCCQSGRMA